jgi:hypothetical protein
MTWRETWEKAARVRVDALSAGARFKSMDGEVWTSGFHHCTRADGQKSGFAGCAEVVLLPA